MGLPFYFEDRILAFFIDLGARSFEKIGAIESVQGSAQRRIHGSLIWGPLLAGSRVFEDDLIQTDSTSEAKIELIGGARVRVRPGSLIRLQKFSTHEEVQVEEGAADIDTTQADAPISLKSKETEKSITLDKGGPSLSSSEAFPPPEIELIKRAEEMKIAIGQKRTSSTNLNDNTFQKVQDKRFILLIFVYLFFVVIAVIDSVFYSGTRH